ncbi:rhomboid family intramembrane serine protease [Oscillibacter sp.]|uniref:rhomboid family intramembrane serine protease n=1 Tax=Oscillibacter sp. TaxID=1945593 RepID=UPI00262C1367|nr:rhomboid family intramembrane serine protease [Oscillibacter sp.]MDD3347313.1 rhomboid family intramembrane serine protease [Oscillibacter sp.]
MRKLCDAVDRFCLNHPRFGIPNLMRYVVFITAAVFLLDSFSGNAASAMLSFDAGAILHGELWRIITWLFIPEYDRMLWMVLGMFFYYSIGTSIEESWGSAKFTLFYLTGAALTVIFGSISLLWSPFAMVTNSYLNNVLFLAFATLYPDALIRFYFVLPIRAKWLALFYVFLTFSDIIRMNTLAVKLLLPAILPVLLAAWLAYAVFFWDRIRDILADIGFLTRHQRSPQTVQFKSAVRQQKKKEAERGYRHKCAVCGRTDADFPELEFRYCSRCAGYHCFCQDHIFSHTHYTE